MKIISIGLALACAAAPAIAQDAQVSVHVQYADLDVQSAAGKTVLESRIRGAAERLCVENGVRDLQARLADRECFKSAMTSGLSQMNQQIAARGPSTTAATAAITGK